MFDLYINVVNEVNFNVSELFFLHFPSRDIECQRNSVCKVMQIFYDTICLNIS